jgi:hypothetical protein
MAVDFIYLLLVQVVGAAVGRGCPMVPATACSHELYAGTVTGVGREGTFAIAPLANPDAGHYVGDFWRAFAFWRQSERA